MATQSSIPAWKIPRTEELAGYIVHGVAESDMTEVMACDGSKAVGLPFKI